MQEKWCFLFVHVEIAAIFAVFFGCERFEWNSVIFFSASGDSKRNTRERSNGNGTERTGRKNLGSGDSAAAIGGSGISGCCAVGIGKI